MASPDTIGRRILESTGNTSGFDYLRLVLAFSVLGWHTIPLCYGKEFAAQLLASPIGNLVRLVLPMFFALSGFLVAASLERSSSLPVFLGLRGLRILPALTVEVLLSALILGPLLTTLPIGDYFRGHQLHVYFLNVTGWIHYELPGVFGTNPYPNVVNGQLWTVPYELECYFGLAILALAAVTRKYPKALVAMLLVASVLVGVWNHYRGITTLGEGVPGRALVLYFLAGVTIYVWRASIPFNRRLFLLSAAVSVALMVSDALIYLSPLPLAYSTAYLGLLRPKRIPVLLGGDYSYGIYLYAFPIQQAVAFGLSRVWYVHLPLSLAGTLLVAAFSWHIVEKPTLRLKRLLKSTGPARARPSLPDSTATAPAAPQ